MARATAALGDPAYAAWLLGHAELLREQAGEPLSADDRHVHEQALRRIRSALAPEAISAAWAAGRATPAGDLARRINLHDAAR